MMYTTRTCKILAVLLAPVAFFLWVTAPVPLGMQGYTGSRNEFGSIFTLISLTGLFVSEGPWSLVCSGFVVGFMLGGVDPNQPWQGGLAAAAASFCLLVLGVCRADAKEKKQYR